MSKKKKRAFRKDVTVGDGKRKTVRAKSKKELDEKVEALKRQVAAGLVVGTGKEKVADLADAWLKFHTIDREIGQSTALSYRRVINCHIAKLFRDHKIEDLNERIILSVMELRQTMSPASRRKILLVLRMIIKYAMRRGMIIKDPMEYMRIPAQKPLTDKSHRCLDVTQTQCLIDACHGTRFGELFILLAMTGMRSGEALALRPKDFTDDFNWVTISRTLSDDVNGNPHIKDETKTDAGKRNVPLPPQARDAVLRELRVMDSKPSVPTGTLFTNSKGQIPTRQDLLQYYFRPLAKSIGLPKAMSVHDLRHTYATCALNAGIGVHLVSKMLGHSSVKITLDLYSHALPDETANAAKVIGGLFSGGNNPNETHGK